MSNADVVGMSDSCDSRYGCSGDRCPVSVRSVRFGVSVSVVSNKVPAAIVLVEKVV